MNIKRILTYLIVLIVVGGGGYLLYQQLFLVAPAETLEPAAEVNGAAINVNKDVVAAEGRIVPLAYANVSFPVGGRVAEILVAEGEKVDVGDPLLRLETAELEIALAQAEAGVEQAAANLAAANSQLLLTQADVEVAELGIVVAEANLALLQADPLPEEIALLESEITTAIAAVNQAAANRDAALVGPTDAEIQEAQARVMAAADAAYVAKEAHETLLHNEIYGDQEERARIASEVAQANLVAAQTALAELLAGPSGAETSAASAGIYVATAQRDTAQAQLDLLLAGVKPEEIAVAEVAVQEAEAAVTRAEANVLQAEAAVTQAEAALAQAEAMRDEAQLAMDNMTLRAPITGSVAAISGKLGDVVSAATPVVTLADYSGWLVETADLTELDVVAVTVGMPVQIYVDAIPDYVTEGIVTDIDAVSTEALGDITYCVTVRLEDTGDLPLRWDMTTLVEIQTQ